VGPHVVDRELGAALAGDAFPTVTPALAFGVSLDRAECRCA